jgi:hypothetical protein
MIAQINLKFQPTLVWEDQTHLASVLYRGIEGESAFLNFLLGLHHVWVDLPVAHGTGAACAVNAAAQLQVKGPLY